MTMPDPATDPRAAKWVIDAILTGDPGRVDALLKKGATPNIATGGDSPLIYAARRNEIEMVRLLLDAGADINYRNDRGETALMTCSIRGTTELLTLLLERGSDVHAVDDNGHTVLGKVISRPTDTEPLTRLCIVKGASIHQPGYNGQTPLAYAVIYNRVDVARLLLDMGADVDAPDHEGKTPFIMAVKRGSVELAQILAAGGADAGLKDAEGYDALYWAQLQQRDDLAEMVQGLRLVHRETAEEKSAHNFAAARQQKLKQRAVFKPKF